MVKVQEGEVLAEVPQMLHRGAWGMGQYFLWDQVLDFRQ